MNGRLRSLLPVLLAVASAGCFTYRPVAVTELPPGRTVRAFLTQEQARVVSESVTLQGRSITGTVVRTGEDRLLLDVPVATVIEGSLGRALNQRVEVPVSGVLEAQERVLDGWRTALMVGGIAAVVVGVFAWQMGDDDNSPIKTPKDPPDALRIPVLRIGIPVPGGP